MPTITDRGSSVSPAFGPACSGHEPKNSAPTQSRSQAGLDGLEDGLVVGQGGKHHDPSGRPAGLDCARGFGTGAIGQPVVHENYVQTLAGHGLGLCDAARDSGHDDICLAAEHLRQSARQKLVVVDEKHPYWSCLAVRFGHLAPLDGSGAVNAGGRSRLTAGLHSNRRFGQCTLIH